MKKLYTGKTKDVFVSNDGSYHLIFKDDVTGENGVFDPGANAVGFAIKGMGIRNLKVSTMFFKALEEAGIKTHFIGADFDKGIMDVKPAKPLGKGLEIICRYRAVGSFLRRYGLYVSEGDKLDGYVEVTLKDDDRGDPLITMEGLEALGILTHSQFKKIKEDTLKITKIISGQLNKKGIELYDIKLEFGESNDGQIILIDEISSGNMRAYKNEKALDPIELTDMILG